MSNKMVPVGLSGRHIHVSQEHLERLFGEGYQLTEFKKLSQPGQYACTEKVDLVGPKKSIKGVRILGPVRKETQVEILKSDAFVLGIDAPVTDSGGLEGTPGVKIVGPEGEVELEKGVIVAGRHIHMTPEDAEKFGVKDGQRVKIRAGGKRGLVFENVLIRVSTKFALDCHLDLEEGNAAGLSNGDMLELKVD